MKHISYFIILYFGWNTIVAQVPEISSAKIYFVTAAFKY